jgi:hypothetical protein
MAPPPGAGGRPGLGGMLILALIVAALVAAYILWRRRR